MKIIREFHNANDGIKVEVTEQMLFLPGRKEASRMFGVHIMDTDSGERFDASNFYPTVEKALEYATKCAE